MSATHAITSKPITENIVFVITLKSGMNILSMHVKKAANKTNSNIVILLSSIPETDLQFLGNLEPKHSRQS